MVHLQYCSFLYEFETEFSQKSSLNSSFQLPVIVNWLVSAKNVIIVMKLSNQWIIFEKQIRLNQNANDS